MKVQKTLSWENCELHPWIHEAIASMGFPTMTPVQASTIPLLSGNKDVVVEAVTGSGKTLAFAIPVLQKVTTRMEEGPIPKGQFVAVVVSPTRELAAQIEGVFTKLIEFSPRSINTQLLVGLLLSVREDYEQFRATQPLILIGTPGRLHDFFSKQLIKTSLVEIAILDEADKLLDISFTQDVVAILKRLPKQKRVGLFSATLSAAGDAVFRTGMNNPVRVTVKLKLRAAPAALSILYSMVLPQHKIATLLHMLRLYQYKKCIVYVPTCTGVKFFYQVFKEIGNLDGVDLTSLHGQLPTKARLKALGTFADGDDSNRHVLMTTDVAARGIDIPDVDLVIQLDPPTDPDVFLHRCGRTGRANKVGQAIVLLNKGSTEENFVDFMEVKGVNMDELELEHADEALDAAFREFMLADRARHELGVLLYVGFVRYYSKHVALSIFRLLTLDYLGLARLYGLMRLPKMPETKYIEEVPENGWLGPEIDMDAYAYADEAKEKLRLATLEADKAKKISDAKKRKMLAKKNEAWSTKVEKKETKAKRIERKRQELEQQLSDSEEEVDWKDLVRANKKQKKADIAAFDDL